jgi:3-dehydroquinate dehydratase-2
MKVLVIHGAGMELRGRTQVDVFGPMTLPEYDAHIRGYARDLGMDVEIFHSNSEAAVIERLQDAAGSGLAAALFNPAGFARGFPALVAALGRVDFPIIEVHVSNPLRRGPASDVAVACRGIVAGFGVFGYRLALQAVREQLAGTR